MPKSTAAAQDYLNSQYRNTPYTPPVTIYVALFTALPSVSGGGTEVSGGSYVRRAVSFAAPTGNTTANDADIVFPTATADWGTIVGYAFFDTLTTGSMRSFSPLSASRAILNGDVCRFPTGQLQIVES